MRPREYAQQILQLPTREARAAALADVPQEWQELVKRHLLIAWNHPSREKRRR